MCLTSHADGRRLGGDDDYGDGGEYEYDGDGSEQDGAADVLAASRSQPDLAGRAGKKQGSLPRAASSFAAAAGASRAPGSSRGNTKGSAAAGGGDDEFLSFLNAPSTAVDGLVHDSAAADDALVHKTYAEYTPMPRASKREKAATTIGVTEANAPPSSRDHPSVEPDSRHVNGDDDAHDDAPSTSTTTTTSAIPDDATVTPAFVSAASSVKAAVPSANGDTSASATATADKDDGDDNSDAIDELRRHNQFLLEQNQTLKVDNKMLQTKVTSLSDKVTTLSTKLRGSFRSFLPALLLACLVGSCVLAYQSHFAHQIHNR